MSAGIYLHIPFCKSRCSYCDFATDVYRNAETVERYVAAICREIHSFSGQLKPVQGNFSTDIDTIYFGGGTPSLLNPSQVELILNAATDKFSLSVDAEVTMEMNPATVTRETLAAFRSLGVNRASFGVQTFDDRALKLLARGHDANDARTTFAMLRESGFDNISFDLIAGLPGQSMRQWKRNLAEAIALGPEHLSLYLLEIHQGTPLAEQVRSGRQPSPDEDLAAEMYELMLDSLADGGYEQYEISNFSRPGFDSRHNSKYWRLDPVIGFGVSAHSFDGRRRYSNERDTDKYVELIEKAQTAKVMREEIDLASEYVFLGLRMEIGIDLGEYARRFGEDLIGEHHKEILDLQDNGLISIERGMMSLTRKGKLFSNEVFTVFV